VRFPPRTDVAAFVIQAGDPEGVQVVPRIVQMAFYGHAKTVLSPPISYPPPVKKRDGVAVPVRKRLYWPVKDVK